jgi:hypothetical protein
MTFKSSWRKSVAVAFLFLITLNLSQAAQGDGRPRTFEYLQGHLFASVMLFLVSLFFYAWEHVRLRRAAIYCAAK